uniref:Uncharacterized protein n=1 Tax=Rhizophora mucronata TaxID=61149 RepID=A0A2P2Q4X2_RHIMU
MHLMLGYALDKREPQQTS